MTVHETVTPFPGTSKEARIEELEQKARKIITQAFSPADVNLNGKFENVIRELSDVKGWSVPRLYDEFGVPMTRELKDKYKAHGSVRTPAARVSVRMDPM